MTPRLASRRTAGLPSTPSTYGPFTRRARTASGVARTRRELPPVAAPAVSPTPLSHARQASLPGPPVPARAEVEVLPGRADVELEEGVLDAIGLLALAPPFPLGLGGLIPALRGSGAGGSGRSRLTAPRCRTLLTADGRPRRPCLLRVRRAPALLWSPCRSGRIDPDPPSTAVEPVLPGVGWQLGAPTHDGEAPPAVPAREVLHLAAPLIGGARRRRRCRGRTRAWRRRCRGPFGAPGPRWRPWLAVPPGLSVPAEDYDGTAAATAPLLLRDSEAFGTVPRGDGGPWCSSPDQPHPAHQRAHDGVIAEPSAAKSVRHSTQRWAGITAGTTHPPYTTDGSGEASSSGEGIPHT